MNINELVGKTLVGIQVNKTKDIISFYVAGGETYRLYHEQDCCESVTIDDINGDLEDLLNTPITLTEEVSNEAFEKEWDNSFISDDTGYRKNQDGYYPDSHTWTFYRLATVKGYVDIRWYGESNGYYSESVTSEKGDNYYES